MSWMAGASTPVIVTGSLPEFLKVMGSAGVPEAAGTSGSRYTPSRTRTVVPGLTTAAAPCSVRYAVRSPRPHARAAALYVAHDTSAICAST